MTQRGSDAVHVADGGGIEEADLGELGDVRDLDTHFGVLGFHTAQGLGQVEADAVHAVAVDDHAVGVAAAGAVHHLQGEITRLLPC